MNDQDADRKREQKKRSPAARPRQKTGWFGRRTRGSTRRKPPATPTAQPTPADSAAPPRRRRAARQPSDRWWWIGGFLIGFFAGLTLSLYYGWVLDPRPAPIGPANLTAEAQDTYIHLVALTYAHNQDITRAQARLTKLEDAEVGQRIVTLTESFIAQNRDVRDTRALAQLAVAFGNPSAEVLAYLPATATPRPTETNTPQPPTDTPTVTPIPTETATTVLTPTATATITPTATSEITATATVSATAATATRTPRPSPSATTPPLDAYGVIDTGVTCDSANGGLLKIYIRDRLSVGVAGVEINIIWSGGRDRLFTGFKPDIDPGYADFQMEPDELYEVQLVGLDVTGSAPEARIVDNIQCANESGTVLPSWQIEFEQGAN